MTAYHDHSDELAGALGDLATGSGAGQRRGNAAYLRSWLQAGSVTRKSGRAVHTLPGPSAAIALTLAGLLPIVFCFCFLPPSKARIEAIAEVAMVRATLVFTKAVRDWGHLAPQDG
jgi:hypothetical protein